VDGGARTGSSRITSFRKRREDWLLSRRESGPAADGSLRLLLSSLEPRNNVCTSLSPVPKPLGFAFAGQPRRLSLHELCAGSAEFVA
jgi:hypothetical protein